MVLDHYRLMTQAVTPKISALEVVTKFEAER